LNVYAEKRGYSQNRAKLCKRGEVTGGWKYWFPEMTNNPDCYMNY
jgi:hypothetical protein